MDTQAPSAEGAAVRPRGRKRGPKPRMLLAVGLFLAAAVPGGRAFVPLAPRQQQPQQQQQQQQRQRQAARAGLTRRDAAVTPDMLRFSPAPSSPLDASPGASRRRPRLEDSLSLDVAHNEATPPTTSGSGKVADRGRGHAGDGKGGGAAAGHAGLEAPMAQAVAAALAEELPDVCVEPLRERAPRLFMQDPAAVRRRIQALKAALPGVNVTQAILQAPRLAWYFGAGASDLEASLGRRFMALGNALGSMADAAELVELAPRVLLRDFETRVQPHLAALASLLPGCDAPYLLRKHPALLGKSVAKHLAPRVAALPSLFPPGAGAVEGLTPETLASMVANYPEVLTAPAAQLASRLEALATLLPGELLLATLPRHPRAWTADLAEEVGPQVRLLRERLGEDTARTVLLNLPSAMYHMPGALARKLDTLEALLGSAPGAHAVLALNPMILAVDAAAHVAPKYRYLRSLFPHLDDEAFLAMLATDAGAKCLTAAFGQLGRLSYLLQVQPDLDLEASRRLVLSSSEELRRWYPGYENFLEDRIEPRFPNYTWEQLCALPFSLREQAHGEILHNVFSKDWGAAVGATAAAGAGEEGEGEGNDEMGEEPAHHWAAAAEDREQQQQQHDRR